MQMYTVQLVCGRIVEATDPRRRFCNKSCQGFFSRNPKNRRWREPIKRKLGHYLSSDSPLWEDAKRIVTHQGYVQLVVRDPKQKGVYYRRMEHIVIWERANGCKVPSGHCIHHVNEIRHDNAIDNLTCMMTSLHVEMHHQLNQARSRMTSQKFYKFRLMLLQKFLREQASAETFH
jgi:hypothetical protein